MQTMVCNPVSSLAASHLSRAQQVAVSTLHVAT
jgi:hypothetical protein